MLGAFEFFGRLLRLSACFVGGVLSPLRTARMNRSSAPGSSLISSDLGVFAMNPLTFKQFGGTLETTPLGGPLDQTPTPDILAAMGAAISSFARLEYMVSVIGLHVNKREANPILFKNDPNSKFPKMLALVRRWLSSHQDYEWTRTELDEFFYTELQKDAEFRNDLAHAFLHAYDQSTGNVELRSIRRTGPSTWQQRAIDTGIAQILGLKDRANLATQHFVEIADSLFQNHPPSETP